MLGGFFALLSAATFGLNTAIARRGVLGGTVLQAMAITVPLGLVLFAMAMLAGGALGVLGTFSSQGYMLLALAGVLHFVWSRYCTYRATKAMGGNLSGPVQQLGLVLTLALAILVLGESLTLLKLVGIVFVVSGPIVMLGGRRLAQPADAEFPLFVPNYREGYLFAVLSTLGASISPILIRLAMPEGSSVWTGVAAGTISYIAAAIAMGLILVLPGRLTHVREMTPSTARLFTGSGIAVSLSQMFRYMALAIAPVTVVTPIQRTAIIFRIFFARLINPKHEVFSARMFIATGLSLAGALMLTMSTDIVADLLATDRFTGLLRWHWPSP